MDELITRPLNRLWYNSKKYAKHQIGEFYGYNKDDGIKMNDVISQRKVKYIKHKNTNDFKKSDESNNIVINESVMNNISNDSCKVISEVKIDHIIPSENNNTIELVTVKLVEPPVKNIPAFVQFNNNINNTEEETEFNCNESNNDSSLFDIKINSTNVEYLKRHKEEEVIENKNEEMIENKDNKTDTIGNKDKRSVIKVKIIVPKGSMETMKDTNGPFSQSNKLVFESHANTNYLNEVTVKNTCVLSRPNSPIEDEITVENMCSIKSHEENYSMKNKLLAENDSNQEKILDKNEIVVESTCIFNDSKRTKQIESTEQPTKNSCIFEENRSRPLSPISVEKNSKALPNIKKNPEKPLKLYEEPPKSIYRHSVPIMGRAALLEKLKRPIDKSTLNDSEIIRDLVRERFIVNPYKSNTLQRSNRNFSRNDKLYRSFDVNIYNDESKKNIIKPNNIIHITQSSPIKLEDKNVSLVAPIRHNTRKINFENNKNNSNITPSDGETRTQTIKEIEENTLNNTYTENNDVNTEKNHIPKTQTHDTINDESYSNKINSNETYNKISTEEKPENVSNNKKLSSSEPNIFPDIQHQNNLSSIIEIKKIEKLEMPVYSICNSESTLPITAESSRCSLATDYLPSIEDLPSLNNFSSLDNLPTFEIFFLETQTVVETVVIPEKPDKVNKNVSFDETVVNNEESSKETSIPTELSSYDMDEFLKKALGDELLDDSTTTVSTIVQDKIQQPKKKIIPEDSICTSDASDLISKSPLTINSSFYHSFTKKLRKIGNNLRNTPTISENQSEEDLNSILPNSEIVNDLVQKAAAQYEAMKQISKALTLCRNTKEFSGSIEQIEGERLLLIAVHKRQALLNEIRRIDYDLDDNLYPSIETGTITINNINFPLKDNTENDNLNPKEYRQWFVCMLSQGSNVLATQIVQAKEKGPIVFPEEFTFVDLPSDFIVNIEIFTILQRQNIRNYSHDSKFHLNKVSKSTHCPSPKSFLPKDKHVQKILSRCDTGVLISSFKPVGNVKIKVADISKAGPWQLRKVPLSSNLYGIISMNIKSKVKIPIKHSGFLTVGRKVGNTISWNRLWCMLNDHLVYFWNYPCDEESIDPLDIIDLKKCVNANIEPADRSVCPRPRTLLLETATSNENNFNTYFFQTDTLLEMEIWNTQLNKIVMAARTWNDSYFSR